MKKEIVSTITSKGQVTIPVEVRRHLGVDDRNKVAFVINEQGQVEMRQPRYPDIRSLAGAAGSLPQPMSWEEVRAVAVEDALAHEYRPNHEQRVYRHQPHHSLSDE